MKNSTSDLFIGNCDEFIYYDDLVRAEPSRTRRSPRRACPLPSLLRAENEGPSLEKAIKLVVETLEAIAQEREADEPIWGSMIKQAIKRINPGFNERAYGFRSFNDLLLEAQKRACSSSRRTRSLADTGCIPCPVKPGMT